MAIIKVAEKIGIPVVLYSAGRLPVYTPVWTGATTNPVRGTVAFEKATPYRHGAVLELDYNIRQTAAGTAGSGSYFMSLPAGVLIDTTLVDVGVSEIGFGYAFNGTTEYKVVVFAQSSSLLRFSLFSANNTTTSMSNGNVSFGGVTLQLSFNVRVPIQGWDITEYVAVGAGTSATLPSLVPGGVEETTHVTNFSGPFAATSRTIQVRRQGKDVTLTFPETRLTGNSTSVAITMVTALPVAYRPAVELFIPIIVTDNGTDQNQTGFARFNANGTVTINKQLSLAAFTASTGATGFYGFSVRFATA